MARHAKLVKKLQEKSDRYGGETITETALQSAKELLK